MDGAATAPSFASLADLLLAHRLSRPDLSGADGSVPAEARAALLRLVFQEFAEVFALGRALSADKTMDEMLRIVVGAVGRSLQASDCRIVLRGEDGSCSWIRPEGGMGGEIHVDLAGSLTSAAMITGLARAFVEVAQLPGVPAIDWVGGLAPRTLACVPLRRVDGEIVGALQLFDRPSGPFDERDLEVASSAAIVIAELAVNAGLVPGGAEGARLVERAEGVVATSQHELILAKILSAALEILAADRGWIFLYDSASDELYTCLSDGLGKYELRVGLRSGVVGAAFRTGETINIADAYQDPRFNPTLDWQLGFRTRSILCAPILNADGRRIGAVQITNKRRGAFDATDESRLKALASQMGVTLDYAELFQQILRMKSYNESMLASLTNGVVTLGTNGAITFVNEAALRILRRSSENTLGQSIAKAFGEMNAWLLEAIDEVAGTRLGKQLPNSEFYIESADEWVPVNLALLPLLDSHGKSLGLMFVIEDLERERELRRTMSRYLSNEVIDRLIKGADDALGGKAQTVTILFSDIRSFTTISEGLGAAGTVTMLNEYFSFMEDVVTNHSGVIDKYIGDAVMALFGSPFPSESDAQNAVQAAYDMHQVLQLVNSRRAAADTSPIRIGVGIATGTVISGNIGSAKRMDFTVIGDAVNLASRIEGLTKVYGADILICAETRARLGTALRMRHVDRVRVQGQHNPTDLYEVLEHRPMEWDAGFADAASAYEAGLDLYLAGDWRSALSRFKDSLNFRPNDKAAAEMIERCEAYLRAPPTDWDGVSNMTHK